MASLSTRSWSRGLESGTRARHFVCPKVLLPCSARGPAQSRQSVSLDEWTFSGQCAAASGPVVAGGDAWSKATECFQKGQVHTGVVKGVNRGGVLVDCFGVSGFIPNSMLSAATSRPEEGTTVRAMFVEVAELQNRMILSQKQVQQAEQLGSIEVGSVVEGKVAWIESYGVFVDIGMPDGRTVSGMVHKSELSWGTVIVPDTVVSVGEWVKVKVLSVEVARGRMTLSLKRMQPDPLKRTLGTMIPGASDDEANWEESSTPLPGLETVIERLLATEGISKVTVTRQTTLPRTVSQDTELWLSTEQDGDHWTVLARAGQQVQELEVFASLTQAELKACFEKVKPN